MGNILAYLNWRGDLSFQERPFCEADNLALAILSYLDLDGVVSSGNDTITIRQAYDTYLAQNREPLDYNHSYVDLFAAMARSRRFGSAQLSHYRAVFDEESATQFAALQIALGDDTCYLSFRGTDNSIIGWQEDFEMGSQVVPAQQEAVNYLNEVMRPEGRYRVGGHSKGGNLAIYSALYCEEPLAAALLAVYNNDGPGLSRDVVPEEKFRRLEGKLNWIIPAYSVIGTLFPHGGPTRIVKSSADGLLQHSAFTWQIEGDAFCEADGISESCQFYVRTFDTWISSADLEHRSAFTRDFFGALRAGGAKTIEDVVNGGVDGFGTILLSIVNSEGRTKIVIAKFIQSFLQNCRGIDLREALRSKAALTGGLLLVAGILLMLFPSAALQLTGTTVGLGVIVVLGRRLLNHALNQEMDRCQKKLRILSCLGLILLTEFLIINKSTILASSHFVLGVLLLVFAFRTIYLAAQKGRPKWEQAVMCGAAIIAILLALVSLTSSSVESGSALMFTLGSFLAACGILWSARAVYQSGAKRTKQEV